MYAAAGGASLASRQARQRQQKNKKAQPPKAAATNLPAKQPQQYPNYTDQAIVLPPRLSRVERNALLRPPSTTTAADRRHSTSNYHLHTHHRRLRESPSICIPVHRPQRHHLPTRQPSHMDLGASTLQLPQVHHLTAADGTLERRCSFVRQVEEMEHPPKETGILDRCNHMCNFEVKVPPGVEGVESSAEEALLLFAAQAGVAAAEYERGSTEYPFSECSQGRAAWVERERGRRCSVSDEAARQQRLKQSEAHHRWMKRNRIHDTSYGGGSGSSDYDDDYSTIAYHQSAAANALLYVGLGTAAIGSIIFFVGTGEKGFKTLELRLIGPTLVACGLLCCLVRILLCACPRSSCGERQQRKRQQRTKGIMEGVTAVMLPTVPGVACPTRQPPNVHQYKERHKEQPPSTASRNSQHPPEMKSSDSSSRDLQQQGHKSKKKVSITTSSEQRVSAASTSNNCQQQQLQLIIPAITEPSPSPSPQHSTHDQQDTCIELVPLDSSIPSTAAAAAPTTLQLPSSSATSCFFDMEYDLQSVSDDDGCEDDDDDNGELLTVIEVVELPKHSRTREPCNNSESGVEVVTAVRQQQQHSGIVLSPSQLQQQQQQKQ